MTTSIDTSYSPRTGEINGTVDNTAHLETFVAAAEAAAPVLAAASPSIRAGWIEAVADAIDANSEDLASLADDETALGLPRLTGEVARAASQLRFYASVAREGSYLQARIDRPTKTTPALARVSVPLGPVAVFGASNFPFAFSVLGNDTASALAAGCPVIAKAHPAHPLTSVRTAELAVAALKEAGAPDGTFALVSGFDAGIQLVQAPAIAAVAFTGSEAAGLSLWRAANDRDTVIPVYAEMGTVNPVVVTRAAAASSMADIARGFVGSFTLGFGQFCTKPGLLFAPASANAPEAVAQALRSAAPSAHMLTKNIAERVTVGIDEFLSAGAKVVETVPAPPTGWAAPAAVLTATLADLRSSPRLLAECFGPVVLVVEYDDDDGDDELHRTLGVLQGALAAAVMAPDPDDPQVPALLERLIPRVGRVTVNDWPTSVAWQWAQQHGGPWPATTDPRTTSVGAAALDRFVRPITYQSVPEPLLPPPLRDANPWGVPRRVDGHLDQGVS
jgi:NADP-dependent aldehyde dehydrogenase